MDEFLDPFWNLDQIHGWAETRDPRMVRENAIPKFDAPKRHSEASFLAMYVARDSRWAGRDIGEELWAASGLEKQNLLRDRSVEILAPGVDVPLPFDAHREALMNRLEKQGKIRTVQRNEFPTLRYLERLFRLGRLVASGNLPGDPRAQAISTMDWAGLHIAVGGDAKRLSVWRAGKVSNKGEGDFENVRVSREQVLREFPEQPPSAEDTETARPMGEDLPAVSRAQKDVRSCLPDLIPNDCIGLADGFRLYLGALYPDLDPAKPSRDLDFETAKQIENGRGLAETRFRYALRDKKIIAMIESLDGRRFSTPGDSWAGSNARQGFWSNFVDDPTTYAPLVPGPDTRVHTADGGYKLAPLFFERRAFETWLKSESAIASQATPEPSDDDARALIRVAMAEREGFVGQEKGAEIVRKAFPNFQKKRAMELVRELTGNDKPGPKGPRKNRADNRA